MEKRKKQGLTKNASFGKIETMKKRYGIVREVLKAGELRRDDAFFGAAPVYGKAPGSLFRAEYFFNFFRDKFTVQSDD